MTGDVSGRMTIEALLASARDQLDRLTPEAARNRACNGAARSTSAQSVPVEDGTFDCAISNGVINLSPHKGQVFAEAARVLRPGGRIAIADIVSEQQLKESIVCDADLWASCIGAAAHEDAYREAIEGAGLRIEEITQNPYEFISERARNASARYEVKSVSVLAMRG